jgi:hypothetical protein
MLQRTNIYLTEPQKTALEKRAKKLGLSTAELIRRLIDESLKRLAKEER